jgi:hypothetical protein
MIELAWGHNISCIATRGDTREARRAGSQAATRPVMISRTTAPRRIPESEILPDRAPLFVWRLKQQVAQHLEPQPERTVVHPGTEQQRHLVAVLVAKITRV